LDKIEDEARLVILNTLVLPLVVDMSFLFPRTSVKNGDYVLRKTLRGHTGAIEILGASDDGKLLASGGKHPSRRIDFQSTNLEKKCRG
jgi:WD40 repeat protein